VEAERYLRSLQEDLDRDRAAGRELGDRVARAFGAALGLAAARVIDEKRVGAWSAVFMGQAPEPARSARLEAPGWDSVGALPPEPPWWPGRALVPAPSATTPRVTLAELHEHGGRCGAMLRLFAEPGRSSRAESGAHIGAGLVGNDDEGNLVAIQMSSSTGDVCWATCRLAATARTLTLKPENGGGEQVLVLDRALAPALVAGEVDYRDADAERRSVSGARGVQWLELLANAGRLHRSNVEGGIEGLRAVGLISADEAASTRRRVAACASGQRVELMGALRQITYLDEPAFAGVQLHSVLEFDDAVSVRWRQLPPPYRPDGPDPWLVLTQPGPVLNWELSDDIGTVYARAELQASFLGVREPAFATGELVYVPGLPRRCRTLIVRAEDVSVQITLP
jgi:hypothetical protein